MADWWDDYAEGDERDAELSRRLGGVEEMAQAMAQEMPPEMPPLTEVNVDTLRAPEPAYQPENYGAREDGFYPSDYGYNQPPQEIGSVGYGYAPGAPPAAVAEALDNRGWLDRGVNSFFGGAGKIAGGALDKMFGTSGEYAAKQADLQSRLAGPDDPAAMYTPHKPSVFGGTLGLIPTALQKMGFDVQDMTPYGLAVMQRDEAEKAAEMESFGHMPEGIPSYGEYPPGADQEAGIVAPPKPMPGGMGGSSKSVKFSGYPDFTKANPYG